MSTTGRVKNTPRDALSTPATVRLAALLKRIRAASGGGSRLDGALRCWPTVQLILLCRTLKLGAVTGSALIACVLGIIILFQDVEVDQYIASPFFVAVFGIGTVVAKKVSDHLAHTRDSMRELRINVVALSHDPTIGALERANILELVTQTLPIVKWKHEDLVEERLFSKDFSKQEAKALMARLP